MTLKKWRQRESQIGKCSFQAWAEMFGEHARLRDVPEVQWATLAKTNLAGKARERWIQVESTLPREEAQDGRVFKNTLIPLFADADKRNDAKKACIKLADKGCLVYTAQGLRHYGRDFLTAWNDIGDGHTITEEGAMRA